MPLILDEATSTRLFELCRTYRVRRLRLFGSAARDDFDPEKSDIDFLVVFDDPDPSMNLGEQFFDFLAHLETHFGRKVDLLEESAIRNKYLKQSAESEAVILYAA